jgi:hypothetical protein
MKSFLETIRLVGERLCERKAGLYLDGAYDYRVSVHDSALAIALAYDRSAVEAGEMLEEYIESNWEQVVANTK